MKLRFDKPTLEALAKACSYTYQIDFEDKLTNIAIRSVLESLILKLAKACRKITRLLTFPVTPVEAYFLKISAEIYVNDFPQFMESVVIKTSFLNPLQTLKP